MSLIDKIEQKIELEEKKKMKLKARSSFLTAEMRRNTIVLIHTLLFVLAYGFLARKDLSSATFWIVQITITFIPIKLGSSLYLYVEKRKGARRASEIIAYIIVGILVIAAYNAYAA